MDDPRSQHMYARLEELSPLPVVVLDLMAMLNDSSASVQEVQEKIKADPALVSLVLKMINSAFYAEMDKVMTISKAVSLLGFSTLKSILMAYFSRNLHLKIGNRRIRESLWRHSLAAALFARIAAQQLRCDEEEAYVAALLHDIGKPAMYLLDNKRYEHMLKALAKTSGDWLAVEKIEFSVTHVGIGGHLMNRWSFATKLAEAQQYHHDAVSYQGRNPLVWLTAFANEMAHRVLDDRRWDLAPYICHYQLTEAQTDGWAESVHGQLKSYQKLF